MTKPFPAACVVSLAALMAAIMIAPAQAPAQALAPTAAPAWAPAPHFVGTSLPTPPEQDAAWTPPASHFSPVFISAISTLFSQGLADPRGCDYDVIRVGIGNQWTGDGGVLTVHGWVLPQQRGGADRFAVCWNGLVYPLVSVGEPASLSADIRALLEADRVEGATRTKDMPQRSFRRWSQNAISEADAVSEKQFGLLKVCLLFRLGEADLAERFWDAEAGTVSAIGGTGTADPYLELASDWVWSLFSRTLFAHMRGDDP